MWLPAAAGVRGAVPVVFVPGDHPIDWRFEFPSAGILGAFHDRVTTLACEEIGHREGRQVSGLIGPYM